MRLWSGSAVVFISEVEQKRAPVGAQASGWIVSLSSANCLPVVVYGRIQSPVSRQQWKSADQ